MVIWKWYQNFSFLRYFILGPTCNQFWGYARRVGGSGLVAGLAMVMRQKSSPKALKVQLNLVCYLSQNQSKSGEVKKSTKKTTQSKKSAGFGRLFGNAAKKQPSTEDKKTSSADTARSSEVGQTVSGSSEISKNVVSSIPKSDTSNRSHSTANDAVSSKTDSVLRTKVADVSKTASKRYVMLSCHLSLFLSASLYFSKRGAY